MAGKLVLATGKKGSGKAAWVVKWYGENPSGRRIARTGRDIESALSAGLDVAFELSANHPKHVVKGMEEAYGPKSRFGAVIEEVCVA